MKQDLQADQTDSNQTAQAAKAAQSERDLLLNAICVLIAPLGYEVIYLEAQTHRQKVLRIYIDHLVPGAKKGIGIEDCARVSRALDEPLELLPEVEAVFKGSYELEVSSPGVDRPLRRLKDFERFSGQEARIHTFRPLTVDEIGNSGYQSRNPKQKNFVGTLKGLQDNKILLAVSANDGASKSSKKGKGTKAQPDTNSAEVVMIPLPLISKANLEPKFEFG